MHKAKLAPFAHIFARSSFNVGKVTEFPPYTMYIKDEAACRIGHVYPLNNVDKPIAKAEIDDWITNDLCEWQSPTDPAHVVAHTSPIFVVHRNMGKDDMGNLISAARVVCDYSVINTNTYVYVYDNLQISELHEQCAGSLLFNSADVKKWFYHVLLAYKSRKYAALRVAGGILLPWRVYHGLHNAPTICHQMMSLIYDKIGLCIQDDITQPIFAANMAEAKLKALVRIEELIKRSVQYNCRLNGKKIRIGFSEGTRIDKHIIHNKSRLLKRHTTSALDTEFEKIVNKTDLQSYLGMVTYISDYIPNATEEAHRLREAMLSGAVMDEVADGARLTIAQQNKKIKLVHTAEGRRIFDRLQEMIGNALLLTTPDMRIMSTHRFVLIVDTSLLKSGSLLGQQCLDRAAFILSADKDERYTQLKERYNICALNSKILSPQQQRYSATIRELLGIYIAFKKHARCLLLKPFDLITDCLPLVSLFNLKRMCTNAKLIRWRQQLKQYEFTAYHEDGKRLALVDYLSRKSNAMEITPDAKDIPIPKMEQWNIDIDIFAIGNTIQYINEYGIGADSPTPDKQATFELNEIHGIYQRIMTETRAYQTKIESMSDKMEEKMREVATIQLRQEQRARENFKYILPAECAHLLGRSAQSMPHSIRSIYTMQRMRADSRLREQTEMHTLAMIHDQMMKRAARPGAAPLVINSICQRQSNVLARIDHMMCEIDLYITQEENKVAMGPVYDKAQYIKELKVDHTGTILGLHKKVNELFAVTRAQTNAKNARAATKQIIDGEAFDDKLPLLPAAIATKDEEYTRQKANLKRLAQQCSAYLYKPLKYNIFKHSALSTYQLFYRGQRRAYSHIINKLIEPTTKIGCVGVVDYCFIKLLKQGYLSLRSDKLLMYKKSRIVVPSYLRVSVMQICHVEGTNHRGMAATYKYLYDTIFGRK